MTSLAAQAITSQLAGEEKMQDYVYLFQPYEVQQILLPETAQSLAVKTFLSMCGIKYQLELRTNAEQMSPSGKLPFIKVGQHIVSEFEPITDFYAMRGKSLSEDMVLSQKAEMNSYMSLVINNLYMAELLITWHDRETVKEITRPRYGSPYPWPLNHILAYSKQWEEYTLLQSAGWTMKSLQQIYEEVDICCKALSERLDNQYFFFLDRGSPCFRKLE
ncbi:metaxin-2-like isoform X2 [Ptychodera flava]|uniref:metaxin-2-like isoform X2 n=1 Tax=Ptychodera flava TaxID=63121 RepID=UPI003969CFC4